MLEGRYVPPPLPEAAHREFRSVSENPNPPVYPPVLLSSQEVMESELQTRIGRVEKQAAIALDEHQREAVAAAVRNGLLILTGGPGTGKTTTINAMI